MKISIDAKDALIAVDLQQDFMPGGTLAVKAGDQIIPLINRLLPCFPSRIFTRDWHPVNHISFAKAPLYQDKSWPAHCIQNSPGAKFHPELQVKWADKIVSKGTQEKKEAYSGFQDTDLAEWLQQRNIQRVFIVGLATDYCVKATALDAQQAGFETYLIQDAVRGVDAPPGSEKQAKQIMAQVGVHLITSQELSCP